MSLLIIDPHAECPELWCSIKSMREVAIALCPLIQDSSRGSSKLLVKQADNKVLVVMIVIRPFNRDIAIIGYACISFVDLQPHLTMQATRKTWFDATRPTFRHLRKASVFWCQHQPKTSHPRIYSVQHAAAIGPIFFGLCSSYVRVLIIGMQRLLSLDHRILRHRRSFLIPVAIQLT